MMLALTYGASPSIAVIQPPEAPGRTLRLPRRGQAPQALAHRQDARTLGRARHERQHPQLLRPVRRPGRGRYMATCFGAFRAAVEEHLPVAVINDWNLNAADLAPTRC